MIKETGQLVTSNSVDRYQPASVDRAAVTFFSNDFTRLSFGEPKGAAMFTTDYVREITTTVSRSTGGFFDTDEGGGGKDYHDNLHAVRWMYADQVGGVPQALCQSLSTGQKIELYKALSQNRAAKVSREDLTTIQQWAEIKKAHKGHPTDLDNLWLKHPASKVQLPSWSKVANWAELKPYIEENRRQRIVETLGELGVTQDQIVVQEGRLLLATLSLEGINDSDTQQAIKAIREDIRRSVSMGPARVQLEETADGFIFKVPKKQKSFTDEQKRVVADTLARYQIPWKETANGIETCALSPEELDVIFDLMNDANLSVQRGRTLTGDKHTIYWKC